MLGINVKNLILELKMGFGEFHSPYRPELRFLWAGAAIFDNFDSLRLGDKAGSPYNLSNETKSFYPIENDDYFM